MAILNEARTAWGEGLWGSCEPANVLLASGALLVSSALLESVVQWSFVWVLGVLTSIGRCRMLVVW
jgi:hypothetical protein